MKSIFINSEEKRLKGGWRILLFLMVFLTLSSTIFFIKPFLGDITKRAYLENYSLLVVAIVTISALVAVFLSRKWWDKKSFRSMGMATNKQTLKDLLFGFTLSGLMAGTFFTLLLLLGIIEFSGFHFQTSYAHFSESFDFVNFMSVLTLGSLSLLLLEHILVGFWEELVFRGYLFQNMKEGLGLTISIVISCVLYGLIHASNPNATLLSTLIIVGFGFMRIYGYLATKALWLSMGMHIGWNFFQGPIFGFAASGHQKVSVLNHELVSQHDYLSGGSFGPEGSILIIPIVLVALLIMKWYSNSSHAIKKGLNYSYPTQSA